MIQRRKEIIWKREEKGSKDERRELRQDKYMRDGMEADMGTVSEGNRTARIARPTALPKDSRERYAAFY